MTPENKVRGPVIRWAKNNGFMHLRMSFRPGVARGVPDDLFINRDGHHCWIEFKSAGKKPTRVQARIIRRLRSQSASVAWFDNANEAIEWLEGHKG